ncbi:hypothetical protein GCM10010168_71350 [Actinoplanes ianthinogenes]|uniref:DUF7489 domain-containing protein n=1 Tax=Actinoplanes ianthinogenes TaxID=122358 RepID=A0ABM7M6R4_9ACTN|nr:hypothetical protein [Actinoplanes ianthinogenes]BCJ47276.1 hypothetical protein Aiant_79330 [Actinoplanes ianthinogenes]GGR42317.1 hypothetical protein GCM10010168_71350 [Actinoplanes ianthinogenes]
MAKSDGAWSGTVVKKSRALMDGSNLHQRLRVRLDGGKQMDVRVQRGLWDEVAVGDRLVKPEGGTARRG